MDNKKMTCKSNAMQLMLLSESEYIKKLNDEVVYTKNKKETIESKYKNYCDLVLSNLHKAIHGNTNAKYFVGNYISSEYIKLTDNTLNKDEVAIMWMLSAVKGGNILAAYRVGQLYSKIGDTKRASKYFNICTANMTDEELEDLNWQEEKSKLNLQMRQH